MLKCQQKIRNTIYKTNHCSFRKHSLAVLKCSSLLILTFWIAPVIAMPEVPPDASSWYGYLFVGDNIGNSSSGDLSTTNYKSGGPMEWGIGIGKHYSNYLSLEGTFEYWGERFERSGAPVGGTENNVIQAGGLGVSGTAVVNYRKSDFHAYLGAGAGYFITGILVTEPGSGLLTDRGAPSDKWLPGYHVTVGADYRVKASHRLGIEIKHRVIKGDFGAFTNGEVDLGGTFLLLMYRHDTR